MGVPAIGAFRTIDPKAAALDSGIVVLSVRAGAYFSFNRIASGIWTMLAEPCRVGGIFDRLAGNHEVGALLLVRDVPALLQGLLAQWLPRLMDSAQTR